MFFGNGQGTLQTTIGSYSTTSNMAKTGSTVTIFRFDQISILKILFLLHHSRIFLQIDSCVTAQGNKVLSIVKGKIVMKFQLLPGLKIN